MRKFNSKSGKMNVPVRKPFCQLRFSYKKGHSWLRVPNLPNFMKSPPPPPPTPTPTLPPPPCPFGQLVSLAECVITPRSSVLFCLTLPAPIPYKERKLTEIFISTLLHCASRGFMKVLKVLIKLFEVPQRIVKIKISVDFCYNTAY